MRGEEMVKQRLDEARAEVRAYKEAGGIAGEMYWKGVSRAFEWILGGTEEGENR